MQLSRRRRILARVSFGLAFLSAAPIAPAADGFQSAFISEIVADNRRGLVDEARQRSGWIEIHNGSQNPVNLNGWFLTDDRANPSKWRFPGVVLLPDKQLVVFASGTNNVGDLAHLHANFRLNPNGGYLALANRASNVVSELAPGYPSLPADTSYGSVRGEPELRGILTRATPGKPNESAGPGFAPIVTFSRGHETFEEPFPLVLSTPSTDAVIRYTVDGTLPNRRSAVFSSSLEITNTAYIRARAYQEGLLPGPPSSVSYLRLATNVADFSSTLPLLVLDTFGRRLPVSVRTEFAHLSLFEPGTGRASLTNRPTLSTRVSQRIRGSTSAGMPQPGFALEFIDEFNGERSASVLGMPSDSDWILYAPNAYDPVLIHNPFVHQLSRDIGRYSPRTRFVEAFIVNATGRVREVHYHGLYVLEEKIKIGRHRVNVDRLGPEDLTPPAVTGGYLLKFDRLGPEEGGVFFEGDRGMVYVEPKEQTIVLPQRAAQRLYLTRYFREFDEVLHGPNWKDPVTGYRAYFDVDAAIDFHVLEVLSGNVDALVLSTYFYKPRNGRIAFGPHWDFDRALGSTDGRDEDPQVWNTGPFFGGTWWPRLFSDPDFWQQWVDRWQALRHSHFAPTNLNAVIDRLAGEIQEAQPRQYRRWDFQPRGGSYQSEIRHMKDWLARRVEFIDGQLVSPPRFDWQKGATNVIRFDVPANTAVFYTLDGSDPRRPQGGVASNALAYTTPISIASHQFVTARARNPQQRQTGGPPRSTPWSGPVVITKDKDASGH